MHYSNQLYAFYFGSINGLWHLLWLVVLFNSFDDNITFNSLDDVLNNEIMFDLYYQA